MSVFTALYIGCILIPLKTYIYQRIHVRCIIALSNQNTLILKCVDSVNSKRSFKSVKSVLKGIILTFLKMHLL